MSFFENTRPPEPAPATQEVKQDWLAVLIGGIFTILGMLLLGVGKVLWAILKPWIAWCTNIEGKTREQTLIRLGCLIVPILILGLFVYRIPVVRDAISLQQTRTINLTNGYRISFPDRSQFVTREARYILFNDGSRIYVAYAGYTPNAMQKMDPGQCQLVPRSERMGFSSFKPPTQAEGFEDEVIYPISIPVPEMHGWHYVSYMLAHPSYWFKGRDFLESITVEFETSSSWEELVNNWDKVWSPPNMAGRKPFEVKALSREHAIACF